MNNYRFEEECILTAPFLEIRHQAQPLTDNARCCVESITGIYYITSADLIDAACCEGG